MKMQNSNKLGWLIVVALVMLSASLFLQPGSVKAAPALQATATFTATSAPTNTPTRTPTPIATQLPLVNGAQGLYNGVRVGNYGVPTPSTNGSAFQSTVGSIDLYSSAGRHTVSINNETGDISIYGSLAATGNFTPTGNIAATSIDVGGGFGSAGCTASSSGTLYCDDAMKALNITLGSTTGSAGTVTLTNGTSSSIVLTGSSGAISATSIGVSTGTITTATVTSLVLGGQTQSGAVRYGTAANYTSGASITHGFTVTPTMCIIFPNQSVTATLTITTTGFSSDMVDTASPIYWMCGK